VKVTLVLPAVIVGAEGINVTEPFVPAGVIVTVLVAALFNVTVKLLEALPVVPLVGPVKVACVGVVVVT